MPPAAHGRGGSARSRRRNVSHGGGEEGGAERWLVTYADMLTLLLVLFIVLFSISVVNTSKFISLKTSLGAVFGDGKQGVLPGGDGVNDNELTGTGRQLVMPGMPMNTSGSQSNNSTSADTSDLHRTYENSRITRELNHYRVIEHAISRSLRHAGLAGSARYAINRRGLVITVVTNALVFPGNSAVLESRGRTILHAIAPPLVHDGHKIEVDGYTNQDKVSTAPYPTGWELSSARASSVVRYLTAYGVAESRLSAVGFSDQHPLYPPGDPRAESLNRRVEIVVLSNLPDSSDAQLQAAANR